VNIRSSKAGQKRSLLLLLEEDTSNMTNSIYALLGGRSRTIGKSLGGATLQLQPMKSPASACSGVIEHTNYLRIIAVK
jgi:hypothetical protein